MAALLTPDGLVHEKLPRNGKNWELDELYEMLNCKTVQIIPINSELEMWLDEEAKLADFPVYNKNATRVFQKYHGNSDVIVGNALLSEIRYNR